MACWGVQRPSQLLILTLLGVHTSLVLGQCRLRFVIDPDASNCTLSGNNALVPAAGARLNAPITQASTAPKPTFQGAFYVTLPLATNCPTALPDLASGLQSTTWYSNGTDYTYQSSTGPYQGVAVQPQVLSGITAGQAYQPQNLLWNLTSSSVTISVINSLTAALTIQGPASLLHGWLYTENALTGNRYDDISGSGEPGSASFAASGWLSLQNNVTTIRFTSFNLTKTSVGSLLIGSTTYTSITTMSLNGTMVLSADVSCKTYCGDYGRCATVNGTTGCQCECGWKADRTGTCKTAAGYCPLWGANNTLAVASTECDQSSDGASVSYSATPPDEGNADIYRPIISFIPVMIQLTLLACFCIAMAIATPWYAANTYKKALAASAPTAVAEGLQLAEGVESRQGAYQQHVHSMQPLASAGGVVLEVPLDEGWQQSAAPYALSFENLSVWVAPSVASAVGSKLQCWRASDTPPTNHKRILLNVTGTASASKLLGLMGPSGSGKSTLLNVLSGQVQAGGRWFVGGRVCVGSQQVQAQQLSRMCAHVPQHDLLLPGLTVEECLRYAAAVRLGSSVSPALGAARVESLLQELHIVHIRSAYGGSGGSGGSSAMAISGGERQRVSLGMELVADSRLLLLDEPTSGLDAFNALSLVRMLARVARGAGGPGSTPRIVIASLHQPSPALFALLDQVLLLARGRVVFDGVPSAAPDTFAGLGLPRPNSVSIAEHMLMAVGDPQLVDGLVERLDNQPMVQGGQQEGGAGQQQGEGSGSDGAALVSQAAASKGAELWSGDSKRGMPAVSLASDAALPSGVTSALLHDGTVAASNTALYKTTPARASRSLALVRKPGVLLWRSVVRLRRDPWLLLMHMAGAIAMGIIVGFVFFNTQKETTAGAIGRLGTIFFTVNIVAFSSLSAMDMMLDERQVVERELVRGYYSPATYMLTKLLVDGLLLRSLPAALYSAPFYWIMGLRRTASAFTTWLGMLTGLTALIGAFIMFLTNLLGSPGRILVTATTFLLLFSLFSGFLANKETMTWVLRWICFVSPFRWTWEGLVINEIRTLLLNLSVADLPAINGYPGYLFLQTLGVDPNALTTDIIVIICQYVGWCLLAILSMYLRIGLKIRGWIV